MSIEEFKNSLHLDKPSTVDPYLQSLWYDKNDNWNKAHDIVDALEDQKAARIHAYLHRKEGDLWNADYWYRRAKSIRPNVSLEKEWEQLVQKYGGH